MDRRTLADTDVVLSQLGLGTVKFGRNVGVKYPAPFKIPPVEQIANLLALAKDLGINVLDTAPAYGDSEARLGALLAGQRQDWTIVSKAGEIFDNGHSRFDFTPEHFEASLHESLKRLNTDYLDILLIHCNDNDAAILQNDALLSALQRFKKSGMVRAIGASTKTVAGGMIAIEALDCAMVTYNRLHRAEKPVLDRAVQLGKGTLIKKIFASGQMPLMKGRNPVQAALGFAFAHPGTTCALIGTINPEHLRENVRALESLKSHPPAPSA